MLRDLLAGRIETIRIRHQLDSAASNSEKAVDALALLIEGSVLLEEESLLFASPAVIEALNTLNTRKVAAHQRLLSAVLDIQRTTGETTAGEKQIVEALSALLTELNGQFAAAARVVAIHGRAHLGAEKLSKDLESTVADLLGRDAVRIATKP